jgi:hypothetical protein
VDRRIRWDRRTCRRAQDKHFVHDAKRESGPLCEAVGVRPISLVPGVRLNPLASRPEEHAQLELLPAVALARIEAGALRAVRENRSGEPTLPEIGSALCHPIAEIAARLRTEPDGLAAEPDDRRR